MSRTLRRSNTSDSNEWKRKDKHIRGLKCYKESTCKPGCFCKIDWGNSKHKNRIEGKKKTAEGLTEYLD